MRNWQRDYFNLLERLKYEEKVAKGWKAMAIMQAEGKDLLRRELDNLERDMEKLRGSEG